MFNGNLSYTDVLKMPTDMRLNYAKYVSDQYESRSNQDKKVMDSIKNQKPKREIKPPIDIQK